MNNVRVEKQPAYKSFEDYLRHFYGVSGPSRLQATLEASFGRRLARRVLEIEHSESDKNKLGATA
jgi:hypothetical protein